MSPRAGFILQDQIVPRLRSAIPTVCHCVGSEDAQELIQDSIALAAKLMHNVEAAGKAATLLLASDSPSAFVRSCLVKKRDAELGVVDLYSFYQEWCRENHVRPFASRPFTSTAKEEIEIGLGMKLRHDLEGGKGRAKRGWKGLGLVERFAGEKCEIRSFESVG